MAGAGTLGGQPGARGLDGAVARHAGRATDRGGYLDVVADFTVYGAFVVGCAIGAPYARTALLVPLLAHALFVILPGAMAEQHGTGGATNRGRQETGAQVLAGGVPRCHRHRRVGVHGIAHVPQRSACADPGHQFCDRLAGRLADQRRPDQSLPGIGDQDAVEGDGGFPVGADHHHLTRAHLDGPGAHLHVDALVGEGVGQDLAGSGGGGGQQPVGHLHDGDLRAETCEGLAELAPDRATPQHDQPVGKLLEAPERVGGQRIGLRQPVHRGQRGA